MNRTTDTTALLRACLDALEAWGHEEDGIPQLYSDGRPGDPWGTYLRLCAALCPLTGTQRCITCADRECVDNQTPEKMP